MPHEYTPIDGGASGASMSMTRAGGDLLVEWTADAGAGNAFQLYCDGRLVWHGTGKSARVPYPDKRCRIELVTCPADQRHFATPGVLPASPMPRARLNWRAGVYQAADLAGFKVYSGTTPGGAVSYASPVGDVPLVAGDGSAAPGGFGSGGWSRGVWGTAAADYEWTSAPLSPGTWNFAVRPYDAAGNEGTASTVSVTLAAPPRPPAAYPDGRRLRYTLNPSTRVPTLTWNASPGA